MHAAQPQGDRGPQPPARFGNFSAVKSSPPAAGKDRRYAAVTQLLEVCDGNRLLHRKGIVNPSVMACAMTAPLTQGSPACRKSIFAPLSQFLQLWKSCKNALIERAVGFLPPRTHPPLLYRGSLQQGFLTVSGAFVSGVRPWADGGSVRRKRSGIAGKRTRNARPYGVDAACCARRKRSGSVGQRADVGIGPYLSRMGMPQKTRSTRSALAARSQRSRPVRSRQARSS